MIGKRKIKAMLSTLAWNVYDLHQAMVRDTTGELKSLAEQFETKTTQVERMAA